MGMLGAMKVEGAAKWHTYVLENCPRNLPDFEGGYLDYETAVRDEAKVQTTLDLICWRVSRYDDPETMPNMTLILSFAKPVKHRRYGTYCRRLHTPPAMH